MLLGGASVKAVSDELGYANASSFSRAFARACGCSPRDWLKRERAAGR
jgi:AraC-like DNA-binding protein